jgi:hypothetical protein
MAALAALAWFLAGRAAVWLGFEDIEILVQLAAIFAALTAAERLQKH